MVLVFFLVHHLASTIPWRVLGFGKDIPPSELRDIYLISRDHYLGFVFFRLMLTS